MDRNEIPSHGCEHEPQELRRITRSNGTKHYVMQCLNCGAERKSVARSSPEVRRLTAPPPEFDHSLNGPYWKRRADDSQERLRQKREDDEAERRAQYTEYIESDAWRQKRLARLAIDGRVCQAKMDGCTGAAEEVHHWTYQHFGNEPLFELVSVCRVCHDQITEMDHRNRGGNDERLAS